MEKRTQIYQEGNTLKTRIITVPTRDEEILALPPRKPQARPRPERRINWAGLGIFSLMTLLTVFFAVLCFSFLSLNASLANSRSNIFQLENRLAELRTENQLMENRLEAQVDLKEVYEIATEQLGMVYPNADGQIGYSEQLREYIRQYEDIPR